MLFYRVDASAACRVPKNRHFRRMRMPEAGGAAFEGLTSAARQAKAAVLRPIGDVLVQEEGAPVMHGIPAPLSLEMHHGMIQFDGRLHSAVALSHLQFDH